MKGKYARNKHVASCESSSKQSTTWSRVLKVKDMAEEHMLWCIANGEANFLYDKFMDFKLCAVVYPPQQLASLTIKEALQSSIWKRASAHVGAKCCYS